MSLYSSAKEIVGLIFLPALHGMNLMLLVQASLVFGNPDGTPFKRLKPVIDLLCYLTGLSRFIGILEVIGEPFKGITEKIWKDEDFPCRLKVKPVVALTPETGVPVLELRDKLSFFQNLTSAHAWTGHFRSSPTKWTTSEGEAIVHVLLQAKENPIKRPFDERKL